jgi:hypothetical protein
MNSQNAAARASQCCQRNRHWTIEEERGAYMTRSLFLLYVVFTVGVGRALRRCTTLCSGVDEGLSRPLWLPGPNEMRESF